MILNNIRKSLGVELPKFLHRFLGPAQVASKQAFSKARYKLRPEAFVDLNDTFMQAYYGAGGQRLYRDKYLLLATDGSDSELPWEAELRAEFGIADNGQGKKPMCMAKGVKIWDVLNQLTKSNKYQYRINRSVAAGLVKDEIPAMLFGKEEPLAFYERMIKLVLRHREPVRPGRTFPRERKTQTQIFNELAKTFFETNFLKLTTLDLKSPRH